MKNIPEDPIICLSFINTQLRDYYSDLDELCKSFDIEKEELTDRLGGAGFIYRQELNQFR